MRKDMEGLIRYSCSQCAEQPYLYQALGHDGPPQNYYDKNAVTGEPLLECPVMTLLKAPKAARELERMEDDYQLFKAGFLKVSGGIVDQPARWLEWMRMIGEKVHAVQRAYSKSKEQTDGAP